MKKIWGCCMLLGCMGVSSVPSAWAQQTTPPLPAAANPSSQTSLNTGTNAPNPATATTANSTATANTNSNVAPTPASATPTPAPPQDSLDAITKTFSRAAKPAPAPVNPNQNGGAVENTNTDLLPLSNATNPTTTTPTVPVMTQAEMQAKAFDNALNGVFPLTPEQIQQVMKRMNEAQQAGHAPPDPDPTPVVKIEEVSLDPGVAPPLIKVASGYVTTINILDVTGQPWPIQDVVVGGNFQVTGPNDAQVLRLIPQTRFGRGNLSVRLVGLSTPLTFRVEAGGNEVYYRYDARIPQSGPGAKQSLIDHGFTGQAGDSTLMAILAGVPPKDAVKLELSGTDGRTKAWKMNDQVYLRTPLTLLSPGWDASVRSADGTSVYVMQESPVLMLSDNGQMVRSRVDIPPEDPFRPSSLKDGKITVPVTQPTAATTNPLAPTAANNGAPLTEAQIAAARIAQNAAISANAANAAPGTTAAAANTNNNNVTKLPGGVTIYSNGATPVTQPRTNVPISINLGGGS